MRSSRDEGYISGVSCSCVTCSSNSVASTGAGGVGRPQLGFPRLRFVAARATGIAIGPDHTPPWVTPSYRMRRTSGICSFLEPMSFGSTLSQFLAYLWQYGRPGGTVVFDFRLGRGRDGPRQFLGQFEGILQTDGYAAYDQIGGPRMVHAGCWAHCRRQFFEAVQLNPRDPVATPIVARMDELFAVDAEARRREIGLTGRHALRQERARHLLDDIRGKIEAAQSFALPSSALSKACQYALTLWTKLTRLLEYPELELSNNLAENSMRPVALGRKNWIHVGSPQAGPKIAAILSAVESCRRLRISVRNYLAAVLPGLGDVSIQRLPDLTPAAWVAQHS